MYKIFKYNINPLTKEVTMPRNHVLLRAERVDDDFYHGDFVWAIVNVDDPKETFNLNIEYPHNYKPTYDPKYYEKTLIGVKEKQSVFTYGEPEFSRTIDGNMFVYSDGADRVKYDIAVYKTGQKIDLPIDRLKYIGCNKLIIMQELCLYTFLVKEPHEL